MGISAIYSGNCSIFAWFVTILLFVGLIAELAINAYWWSIYHPWGAHYEYLVLGTYICTLICWIFALISIVFLILIVISNFIPALGDNGCASCFFLSFFDLCAIITFLMGFITGVLGLINIKYQLNNEKYSMKCLRYLFLDFEKPIEYAIEHKKEEDYGKWLYKIFKKAIKSVSDLTEEQFREEITPIFYVYKSEILFESAMISFLWGEEFKNDLCSTLGAPSLVFALVLFVALNMFCCSGCCCCCGQKSAVSGGGY